MINNINYKFIAIKTTSIIYLSALYFIIGFGGAILFNKLIPYESEEAEKQKSKLKLLIESLIIFSLACNELKIIEINNGTIMIARYL